MLYSTHNENYHLIAEDTDMNFKDIIKNSVLEAFSASDLFTSTILLTIALSAAMGLYVYMVYRLESRNGFYSRGFNKTLALLPSITASIVLAMQSNLVVSLGMVGALSIVRFRNAVKNPSDLAYLFWSISLGILLGAQLYELTFFAAFIFTAMTFFIDLLPQFRAPCLLVISASDSAASDETAALVKKHAPRARLRSRSLSSRGIELIYELRIRDDAKLVSDIGAVTGVTFVNLITHDGEMRV